MIPIDEYHLVTYETYNGSHVLPPVHPLLWRHVSHHHCCPFDKQAKMFQADCQHSISTSCCTVVFPKNIIITLSPSHFS